MDKLRKREMDKLSMQSEDGVKSNIEKIKELFPNVVTETQRDGKTEYAVDFEALKQELSSELVKGGEESYGFTWPGKDKACQVARLPSKNTLRPCKEESVDFDTTQNLYIEGDNLDVLKLLKGTYRGKVKMIYIDPPYNTGKDFIYNDNFVQSKEDFEKAAGERDEDGNWLVSTPEKSARFHTNWLNMIYPRLKLSRELLSDDGVIFISIDDNEYANLQKICDEIFGEANRLETFHIQVRYDNKSLNEKDDFQKLIEYVLIYAKNKRFFVPQKDSGDYDLSKFCYEVTELAEGKKIELGGKIVELFMPGQYKIEEVSSGGIGYLKQTWASGSVLKGNASGKFFDKYLAPRKGIDGLSVLYKVHGIGMGKDGDGLGYRYFTGPKKADATQGIFYSGVPLKRIEELKNGNALKYKPIINYYDYSADFGNIRHEGGVPFNSGKKPLKMLKNLIALSNLKKDDIVLDFFSGSSSTAHAVMRLNAEDGGHRKFIMVQLQEKCKDDSDFENICELGKARIRNVREEILKENPLVQEPLDLGFRVLKLDSSNMNDTHCMPASTNKELIHVNNVKEGRTPLDLLFQTMLDIGVPLSSGIEEADADGKKVFKVDGNYLICCFDEDISDKAMKKIAAEWTPKHAVFYDSSFIDDSAIINCEQFFATFSPETTVRVI